MNPLDTPEFKQWADDLNKGFADAERAPKLNCPACGYQMMQVIGSRKIAGYTCSGSFHCVGVHYTTEDLCDAERYKAITEDLLARKKKYEDMRTRNEFIQDPTPEQRRGLSFCLTCRGYHPPTTEHPACDLCGANGCHAPFPVEAYFDFKGWRFRPPFHCMCCGKMVCFEQWAFGRSCGTCDTGRCNTDNLHPRTHKVFCGPNTELIDPTEAEKFNFMPERMAKIPPDKPLEWYERKTVSGLRQPRWIIG